MLAHLRYCDRACKVQQKDGPFFAVSAIAEYEALTCKADCGSKHRSSYPPAAPAPSGYWF